MELQRGAVMEKDGQHNGNVPQLVSMSQPIESTRPSSLWPVRRIEDEADDVASQAWQDWTQKGQSLAQTMLKSGVGKWCKASETHAEEDCNTPGLVASFVKPGLPRHHGSNNTNRERTQGIQHCEVWLAVEFVVDGRPHTGSH